MQPRIMRPLLRTLVVLALAQTPVSYSRAVVSASAAVQPPASESFVYGLQDNAGTTVYRHSPGSIPTVIFADHDIGIAIHDLNGSTRLVITPAGRLFAYVKPRSPGLSDFFPRGQTVFRTEQYRTYVYELTTDGSNVARRVAEVLGTQSPRRFLASPSGRHIAYLNIEWERDDQGAHHEFHWLYVHDTRTGELTGKVDPGIRSYDNFKGAAWLDDARLFLWRLPVVEVHLAQDQDVSKSIGPHVIDVTTGAATTLNSAEFLTMLDEEDRRRADAAPECGTALDGVTLLCTSSSFTFRSDPGCSGVLRERRAFTFHLDEMRAARVLSTGPTCADRWFLSPSMRYVVGLEPRGTDSTAVGARLFLSAPSQAGTETVPIVETSHGGSLLVPVGWTRR